MATQQLGARRLSLHQHRLAQAPVLATLEQVLRALHLGARGEQHEGAALDLLQVLQQQPQHLGGVALDVLGVVAGLDHHQPALPCMVEGTEHLAHLHIVVLGQATFVQKVVEAATGDQRRRGGHGRPHTAPELAAQQAARVERAGVGREGDQPVVDTRFQPLGQRGLARLRLLQPELCGGRHVLQPGSEGANAAVELRAAGGLGRFFTGQGPQPHGNGLQLLEQGGRAAGDLAHGLGPILGQHAVAQSFVGRRHAELETGRPVAPVAWAHATLPASDRQPFGRLGQARHGAAGQIALGGLELARQRRCVHAHHVGDGPGHIADRAGQLVKPAPPHQVHALGELGLRNAAEVMGLVKHQVAIGRIRQGVQAERREQQVVIDHDHLGLGQAGAGLVVAAAVVAGAMAGGAGVALGRDRAPEFASRRLGQPVPVTIPVTGVEHLAPLGVGARLLGPGARQRVRRDGRGCRGFLVTKQVGADRVTAGHLFQLEAAHIAPASLGQRKGKGLWQRRGQGRQVLADQLFLQRHGGRGNHHPLALRQRQGDHGGRVRGGFAHPGAGLHHRNRPGAGHDLIGRFLGPFFGPRWPIDGGQGGGNVGGHLALALAQAKARQAGDHMVESAQGQGFAGQGAGGQIGGGHGLGHGWRGQTRIVPEGVGSAPPASAPGSGMVPVFRRQVAP